MTLSQSEKKYQNTFDTDGNKCKDNTFVKKVDAWWTVLVIDRIAIPLVKRISRYQFITPNILTIVSFITSLIAALLILHSTPLTLILGGILYQIAFLFDCMDGKLARLRKTASPLGEVLDNLADRISILILSLAVGFSLYKHYEDLLLLLYFVFYAYLTVVASNIWLIYDKWKKSSNNIKHIDNITLLSNSLIMKRSKLRAILRFFERHRLWPYPSEIEFNLVLFTILPVIHAMFSHIFYIIYEYVILTINITMIIIIILRLYFIYNTFKERL